MRLFFAILRQEWLMQRRALRFRAAVVVYVGLNSVPPILSLLDRQTRDLDWSATAFHAQTQLIQPFLTVLLALLVAGHESGFEAQERRWPVLASAPLSSGAFLLRRWLAILVILLPLTVLPMFAAIACAALTETPFDSFAAWLGPWLLHIVPLAVATSAGWLGLTTIAGSEVGALAIWFLSWNLFLGLLNKMLLRWRLRIEDLSDWISFGALNRWPFEVQRGYPHGHAATTAPYDMQALIDWTLPRGMLGLALGLLFLGLGVVFVRRTRRDLKPQPIHDQHPLRTLLPAWHRFRQRYSPDAATGFGDRVFLGLAFLLFAGAIGFLIDRQQSFQALAEERYEAEIEHVYPPMPEEVRPRSLRIAGRIEKEGRLDLGVDLRLDHGGDEPLSRLPFSLNQGVEISEVKVRQRTVRLERFWDRVLLTVEPAFLPGEELDIHFAIAGSPGWLDWRFFHTGRASFVTRWENFLNARFASDLADVSRAERQRAISSRRVALGTSSLAPMPRYSPWTLTPPADQPGEPGREVPIENIVQVLDIELELEAPEDLFLASHCGDASRVEDGKTVLRSSCRSSILELMVCGGAQQPIPGEGRVQLASLSMHRQQIEMHRESLESLTRMGDEAWPGLPPIDKLVAIEWPPPFDRDLRQGMWSWEPRSVDARHRMILLPETRVIQKAPLVLTELVNDLLGETLLARREFEFKQAYVVGQMLSFLMLQRMGLQEVNKATISVGGPWIETVRRPILVANPYSRLTWIRRLPAVLVELEHRVGSRGLYEGLEAFLAAPERPGTVREAFRLIEEVSGEDLELFYQDYFEGNALPQLQLQDVELRADSGGFEVRGKVLNTDTGHPRCPLVVKSEAETQRIDVEVLPEAAVEFKVRMRTRPHTVQLDPDRTCHRLTTAGSMLLERVSLEEQ